MTGTSYFRENLRKLLHQRLQGCWASSGHCLWVSCNSEKKQTQSQEQGKFLWAQQTKGIKNSLVHIINQALNSIRIIRAFISCIWGFTNLNVCGLYARSILWFQKRVLDISGSGITNGCETPVYVPGTEPMSSGRAASAFNCSCISPAPQITLLRQNKSERSLLVSKQATFSYGWDEMRMPRTPFTS